MTVQPLRKPYRPSNGTEGELFYEAWCAKCWRDSATDKPREDYANGCRIISRALLYNVGDPGYPTEWVQDDEIGMEPRCTAFAPRTGPKPGRWAALKAWATRRERKARSFAGSLFVLLVAGCATISPNVTPREREAIRRQWASEDSTREVMTDELPVLRTEGTVPQSTMRSSQAVTGAAHPTNASDWSTGFVEPMRYFPVPLSFVAPGDSTSTGGWRACSSYEVQMKRPDGSVAVIPVWRDSSIAVAAIPQAPGSVERVWVLHDTLSNWRTGGTTYRLRGVDGAGNRPEWSNAVVVAVSAYLPDTLWGLRREPGGLPPVAGGEWQFRRERNPAGWMVSWDLAPGDTVAGAFVEHFEMTQGRHLAALRAIYGYACRRGVRDSLWTVP